VRHSLIDEYRQLVYPVVWEAASATSTMGAICALKLVESKSFRSGIFALTYQASEKDAAG